VKYTKEQIDSFDHLKKLEQDGISSLVTDVIIHREAIEKEFTRNFAIEFDLIKNNLSDREQSFDERLVRNFACILAPVKILLENKLIDLGFSYDDLFDQCLDMINDQTAQISSSEAVSTFWMMIQFMYESKPSMITQGEDFKIQTYDKILTVKNRRDQEERIDLTEQPVKLIFFRFSKIHPLYMEAHRKQYGKNGVDMVSLIHYIKHHKAYIGHVQSWRFDKVNTSAFVFDYNKLNKSGLNLEDLEPDSTEDLPF
jgi:hypothetical protein